MMNKAINPRPARRPRGAPKAAFTVVEMLIVLAIMAILAAMAVPMMTRTEHTQLRAAADRLVADLAFAQIHSISHGDDPCVVVFDADTESYRLTAASDTGTALTNPIGKGLYQITYGQGTANDLISVTIDSYDLDGDDQLGFGIYGQLDQAANATVTLESGGSTLTVTVDPVTGETSIGQIVP